MNRENVISMEILRILRDTVIGYNENIAQHNRIINSYNTNISHLLNTVHFILEREAEPRQNTVPIQPHRETTNINQTPRRRTHTTRGTNLSELERINGIPYDTFASLVYLLNIPYPTSENRTILTTQQIINGTQLIHYNDTMREHRCPISLDDFEPNERICQIRGCNHIFKTEHLMRWFETHNDCPVCRYNLSTESAPPAAAVRSPTTNLRTPAIRPTLPENNMHRTGIDHIWEIQRTSLDESEESPELVPVRNTNTNATSPASTTNTLLNSRFSQLLSDMILEQLPIMDSSNNLLYTIEIPLTRNE